jgi:hypothetical protein
MYGIGSCVVASGKSKSHYYVNIIKVESTGVQTEQVERNYNQKIKP